MELFSIPNFLSTPFGADDFYDKAPLLAQCDLARVPYKEILKQSSAANALIDGKERPNRDRKLERVFRDTELLDLKALGDFLGKSRGKRLKRIKTGKRGGEQRRPYLFPTRPYTPCEVAELVPWCIGSSKLGKVEWPVHWACLLYTSPSPRDATLSRMPSSA